MPLLAAAAAHAAAALSARASVELELAAAAARGRPLAAAARSTSSLQHSNRRLHNQFLPPPSFMLTNHGASGVHVLSLGVVMLELLDDDDAEAAVSE